MLEKTNVFYPLKVAAAVMGLPEQRVISLYKLGELSGSPLLEDDLQFFRVSEVYELREKILLGATTAEFRGMLTAIHKSFGLSGLRDLSKKVSLSLNAMVPHLRNVPVSARGMFIINPSDGFCKVCGKFTKWEKNGSFAVYCGAKCQNSKKGKAQMSAKMSAAKVKSRKKKEENFNKIGESMYPGGRQWLRD